MIKLANLLVMKSDNCLIPNNSETMLYTRASARTCIIFSLFGIRQLSITSLVVSVDGGLGDEFRTFIHRIAE